MTKPMKLNCPNIGLNGLQNISIELTRAIIEKENEFYAMVFKMILGREFNPSIDADNFTIVNYPDGRVTISYKGIECGEVKNKYNHPSFNEIGNVDSRIEWEFIPKDIKL